MTYDKYIPVFLSAVIIITFNLVVYNVNAMQNEIIVSKGIFSGAIKSVTTSSSFMDDVYTFRVDQIGKSIRELITLFEENNSSLGICVNLQIRSFNSDEKKKHTYCSEGASPASLVSDSRKDQVAFGEENILIGQKNLGSVSWMLAPVKKNRPVLHAIHDDYFIPLLYACFEIILLSIVSLLTYKFFKNKKMLEVESVYQHKLSVITKKGMELSEENASLMCTVKNLETRIENIAKILDTNKRYFAINNDIQYVQYIHPYTSLYFSSGKCIKIRCSLTVLKHSFPIDWIQINRASLVNIYTIQNGCIEYKTAKKGLLIIHQKNKNSVELEIGRQYKEDVMAMLTHALPEI